MTNNVHTEYIDLDENGNKLEIAVYYSLGGMNYFNYKQEPRGYYGSVTPVKIEKSDGCTMKSFGAFTGTKTFLLECGRKSAAKAKDAIKLFESKKLELIEHVKSNCVKRSNLKEISKKLGISIPPRFEGYTEEQILNLPIEVCGMNGRIVFDNLKAVDIDLKKYCGAMYGEVNKKPALRFEDSETNRILSN